MDTRKVLGIIFSILFVGAFTFVLCWGIINFNKVKDSMSSTGVYTEQDVNNAYQDGYDTALQDKQSYDELINSYRDTITTLTDEISQLSSQVTSLTNANRDYANQITNLENQKSNLTSQVENLTTIKTDNEHLISELNKEVDNLQSEVSRLVNSGYNNEQELAQKNTQITNLQNTVTQLQKTNELNVQTINNLNNQVTSLNSQISEMTFQIQNNSTNVTSLHIKIAELEKSVAYYEQYIASLENGEQVVATFEFDGSVYNIQIVNPNSLLSVATPNSTEYIIFNHWTVNGVEIDLSTYKISQNTKIVADVTYRYKTEFIVNDDVYNSQIVTLNDYATLPTNPSITGYDFDGWTLNGIDLVDPTTIEITKDTQFIAKLTKLHKVKFYCENELIDEQIVRNGNFVEYFEPTLENAIFNGWTVNDIFVDLTTYKIVAETVVIADISYPKFNVAFYDGSNHISNQEITYNSQASINYVPEKIGSQFMGWSVNGTDVVDVSTYKIVDETSFTAVYQELPGGLYQSGTHQMISSWDTLIANGDIVVSSKKITSVNVSALNGDLYIPNNEVTSIATKVFKDCIGLTGIIVPNSVTAIEYGVLTGCYSLEFMSIPFVGKNASINNEFGGSLGYWFGEAEYSNAYKASQYYEGDADGAGGYVKYYYFPTALKTIRITKQTTIPRFALQSVKVSNVILEDCVTSIDRYAFMYCGVSNLRLSNNLRYIYQGAFAGCGALKNVFIPKSLTTIYTYSNTYNYTFGSVEGRVLYFEAETPPTNYDKYLFNYGNPVELGVTYYDYLKIIGVIV